MRPFCRTIRIVGAFSQGSVAHPVWRADVTGHRMTVPEATLRLSRQNAGRPGIWGPGISVRTPRAGDSTVP